MKPLSAQQLVDCSQRYGNMGCNGGDLMAALRYTQAKGVELQSDYPYVSGSKHYIIILILIIIVLF